METKLKNQYTADSIHQLTGLAAVRKRPGMYIGGTDVNGLHHLVWEIVDNSIDEALGGFANKIKVVLRKDGSVLISDNGRGIPVEKAKGQTKTAVELVFTTLHAGGKFDSSAYKSSGGLHGVGASVTNALSTKLIVTVARNGKLYRTAFEQDKIIERTTEIGKSKTTGTTIQFWPDYAFFKRARLNFERISERLKESAFLISDLEIELIDEENKIEQKFQYQNGLESFLDFVNDGKNPINKPITFKDTKKDIEVHVSFQWSEGYNDLILSFVNNVKTKDGGTHETGFKTALTRTFNEFAGKEGALKKGVTFDGEDIREGLTCIISLKVPENLLEFVSQTKDKLGTPEARQVVDDIVSKYFQQWITENKKVAKIILDKVKKAYEIRIDERKRKEEARTSKKNLKEKVIISDKLTPAASKKVEERELFLVEGDSAGGSAKNGRDKNTQAILPLRGKVINSDKAKITDVLKNNEIITIINAIGAGFGKDFDISKIQYGKIVIMTDADTDGAHIQTLLLTFFFRFMKPLIEQGKVFIAIPPLYKLTNKSKKTIQYLWSDEELREKIALEKGVTEIQRYKGLGEMNADQLWETTMNPETRSLIQISIDDLSLAERRVTILMSDDSSKRREWIEKNIDFENYDDYLEKIDEINKNKK
ncbi:DNA gyrase/topoisomerase IV subunit B [Mycoplasma leonicaptivi]|uniref:DNA gyrase/topoisomerase IV subunit B n=1 Tax=Mycoplasma leonicaptivi TaxID=36742 RepID=UPI00056C9ACD|nr:DNA topoisomerase IV subunit B [Mycoplasma leonicaptivi]